MYLERGLWPEQEYIYPKKQATFPSEKWIRKTVIVSPANNF